MRPGVAHDITQLMQRYILDIDPSVLIFATFAGLVAGLVKGVVGFGMPMILLSGLAIFMPIYTAVAALILPTLLTNLQQAREQGLNNAIAVMSKHKIFIVVMVILIFSSAALTPRLPQQLLLGILGIFIVSFSVFQMSDYRFSLSPESHRTQFFFGSLAGVAGGLCGAFGPPTVAYLTAINTPKNELMKIQALIYGTGATLMFFGHITSGIFNLSTAPLSSFLILPCICGFWLGSRIRNTFDQKIFRKVTLVVLILVGANLIRRAWLM